MIGFLAHSHDHYNQSFDRIQEVIEPPIGIFPWRCGNPAEVSPVSAEAVTQASLPFQRRTSGGMGTAPVLSLPRNSRLLRSWDGL